LGKLPQVPEKDWWFEVPLNVGLLERLDFTAKNVINFEGAAIW